MIVGQDAMLERVLVALLAGGHLLLEGVPGLAKTLTIKTLADVLHASFRRIQFTPDLVPGDLVGTRIYRPDRGTFDTELGPVFCNFLLADEINRAPAKVQSALLEVMQERQVTIGPESHAGPAAVPRDGDPEPDRVRGHLPAAGGPGRPVHDEGRRRLPERARRRRSSSSGRSARRPPVRPILTAESLAVLQALTAEVYVDRPIVDYAVALTSATRFPERVGLPNVKPYIAFGASPRGSINLVHAARALALVRGRRYVVPGDVVDLARDVLRHRVVPSFTALAEEVNADMILDRLIGRPGPAGRPGQPARPGRGRRAGSLAGQRPADSGPRRAARRAERSARRAADRRPPRRRDSSAPDPESRAGRRPRRSSAPST